MNADRASLAEAFKPFAASPKRGASLQGLLKPKARPSETGNTAPMVAGTETNSAETPLTSPRGKAVPVGEPDDAALHPASRTVPGAPRNVGVYLPPEVLERVKSAAKTEQITYSDLLVDAFNAVSPEQISHMFTPVTEPTESVMPRRVRRPRGTAGIQIQLRLDDHQIAWLEDQVAHYQAPSRSALVSAVLRLHTSMSYGQLQLHQHSDWQRLDSKRCRGRLWKLRDLRRFKPSHADRHQQDHGRSVGHRSFSVGTFGLRAEWHHLNHLDQLEPFWVLPVR